ncbi:MAG TPA: prephenate dehydrogenase/arogenate dehydrogenase family protein [Candidatus Limnocylindria bacterium]|nr:prephenate dehydrogenase/arogenate dehydrogenase family protein [Candidatus Limnocylindria bacterium]
MTLGRVGIVGTGQIGTAIGCALGASGAASEVVLHDRDDQAARRSLARGAGRRSTSLDDAIASDTVVLALPLAALVATLGGARFRPGSLVIDTATVKRPVVRAMRALAPAVHAIGGHPVAGTERSGPEGADPASLRGATFALCPVRDDPVALERARALAVALGAVPIVLDADEHDAAVAVTVVLPHLMARALAALPASERLAGPGYRGATRLAAADPASVAEWAAATAGDVRPALRLLARQLEDYEGLVADEAALARRLGG